MKEVAVIGGGASGLMAAYAAAANGNRVTLLEKNEKAGKKIYITGKGRCNLTNDCPPDEFLQNVVRGGKFLTGAIYSFPPARTMRFMEENGLALKVERGSRVFPVSDHASDVTKTLVRACERVGVRILVNTEVKHILVPLPASRSLMGSCHEVPQTLGGSCHEVSQSLGAPLGGSCHEVTEGVSAAENAPAPFLVRTSEGDFPADAVIVATGGLSYPSTGSTGDGYRFAKEAGHTLTPCVPSLVGLELAAPPVEAQGVTLKNVVLTAKRGGKTLSSRLGELLFTHYGVSGPLALSLSAEINRLPLGEVSLLLDFKPALDEKALDARLVRDFTERKNEQMKSVMRGLLPASLVPSVLRMAELSPVKQANAVTREERARLVRALKNFPLTPTKLRGYDEAVVTSGGVSLSEIDPKTMESKKTRGMYFCGEVLDADAYTGGFNLQIAFATGFCAGNSIK